MKNGIEYEIREGMSPNGKYYRKVHVILEDNEKFNRFRNMEKQQEFVNRENQYL